MKRFAVVSLVACVGCLWPVIAAAETEPEACRRLAAKYAAELEVVLPDETRVDLLSETHAWEAEWAENWAEGVGQATLYSIWTGKRPGLILLTRDRRGDKLHFLRAKLVCERLKIDLRIEASPTR